MISTLFKKLDLWLLLSTVGLVVIGLVLLGSASSQQSTDYASRQFFLLAIGLPVFLIALFVSPAIWFAISWLTYGFSLFLLVGVKLMGVVGMGAERWIELGPIRFQPSELAKVALILALGRLLSDNRVNLDQPRWILAALSLAGLPFLLVALQPDLGTALTIAFISLPMMLRAGLPWHWLLMLLAPVLAALVSGNLFLLLLLMVLLGALLYISEAGILPMTISMSATAGIGFALPWFWGLLKEYQQKRILIFLDPEADPLGAGYQIIQSKVAIGSGGFWGKGYLEGTQTQLAFLPERHTDFIFSVLGEEWGFAGAGLVLLLFALLCIRGLLVGLGHRSSYCGLVMTGVVFLLFFHVLINVGMTVGLMPVTGLPLPFLSYGGSFLWICLFLAGLLISFSWRRREGLA
jgi:rod shape determining protein RodA